MALKDLLAVVDTADKDEQFVQDVLRFAEFHGARLTFLVLSVIPSPDYVGTFGPPYIVLHDYTQAVEAKQKRLAELTHDANVEVRTISELPETIFASVSVQARYADMVLFGPSEAYEYPPARRHSIENILFASGRPVLILPHGHVPHAVDHFAIGWNATREATQALRETMLFAAAGAKADILVLDGRASAKGHGSEPGADIAHHLARHGFETTVRPLTVDDDLCQGDALVRGARQHGARLLALGAYGHSRLREMILGGVTRDLLDGAPLPLLFAH
ncbi:universal stress protein (plasmid) [Sphingobium naphthae]|uniref:universal stress protein n=1 Tax=Sphingobium naphthae TaxID=1886786 RepID=UPI000C929EF3|nr:universal stress protein UspA [Erythrobacter sp.]MEA3390963.1 universal stress protein [Pseudomonadota bacterium]